MYAYIRRHCMDSNNLMKSILYTIEVWWKPSMTKIVYQNGYLEVHDYGLVSTRTLANNPTFLADLVPVKLHTPFFLYIVLSPNYHFWKHYICQTFQGFLMTWFVMIRVGPPCWLSLPRISINLKANLVRIWVIMWQLSTYVAL